MGSPLWHLRLFLATQGGWPRWPQSSILSWVCNTNVHNLRELRKTLQMEKMLVFRHCGRGTSIGRPSSSATCVPLLASAPSSLWRVPLQPRRPPWGDVHWLGHKCINATLYDPARTKLLRLSAESLCVVMDVVSLTSSPGSRRSVHSTGSALVLRSWMYSAGLIINIHTPPKLGILWDVLNYGGGGDWAKHIYVM